MKVSPYIYFDGNCLEALELYQKALKKDAKILRYSDAPPSAGYNAPPGTENRVMHATLPLEGEDIYFCDIPPDSNVKFGDNISIMVTFDNRDQLNYAFDLLKEGGRVTMELQQTFWSECFGSLEDKFGIYWMFSV